MTRLEIYLIAFIGLCIVIFCAGLYGHKLGAESVQVKWDKAIADQAQKEQKQINTAVTKLETGNAQAKVVYRTITQTVDKVVEKPVYLNACFDADGLLVANQALAGSLVIVPKPNPTVPRPDATPRRNGGGNSAQSGGDIQPVLRLSAETLGYR